MSRELEKVKILSFLTLVEVVVNKVPLFSLFRILGPHSRPCSRQVKTKTYKLLYRQARLLVKIAQMADIVVGHIPTVQKCIRLNNL
jgi:hypothetical protein